MREDAVTTVILVEGTFGGSWAEPGSPFRQMLEANEFNVIRFEGWSLNVGGVPNLLSRGKHRDWVAGGYGLGYLMQRLSFDDCNIVLHSHGIGVALYEMCNVKIPVRRLISVCSPVRRDLQEAANAAKPIIGRWRHIASSNGDPWQRLGELFDGHLGWDDRTWPQADENVSIPRIGHSKLLNDPKFLDLWKTDGMLDFLRAQGTT